MKKLNSLDDVTAKAAKTTLSKKTLAIQKDAKIGAPSNDGDLRNSIKAEVKESKQGITGRVYTNNDHAGFVEFGTGPVGKGTAKHIPDGVVLTYRDSSWWVNVKDFPSYARYGFTPIDIQGEQYIRTSGQKAQQFMAPAAKKHKKTISADMSTEMIKEFKKELAK